MNHCVNCLHFKPGASVIGFCKLATIPAEEHILDYDDLTWLVTGKGRSSSNVQQYRYATSARLPSFPCGLEGKLFQPKLPTPFQTRRKKLHSFIGRLLRV